MLEGVDLRSSWDQHLDPHISFRHDIVDAEHALRDSLDDLGLILLACVLPLSREVARQATRRLLSLNTSAAIRMLIYAIGNVCRHAGARARVDAVHIVVETEHLRLRRLLLQKLGLLLLLDDEVAEVRRAQVGVAGYHVMPHSQRVLQEAAWLHGLDQKAVLVLEDKALILLRRALRLASSLRRCLLHALAVNA